MEMNIDGFFFFESDPPLTCRHFILYRTAYAIVRQLVA